MTEGRRLATFLAILTLELAAVCVLAGYASRRADQREAFAQANREIVRSLSLTSLSLWSEARYCRHPAEADLFAPFGDHPASIEHYPSGSWVPPRALRNDRGKGSP